MVTVIAPGTGQSTLKAATPILPQGLSHTGLMPQAQPQAAVAASSATATPTLQAAIQQQLQQQNRQVSQ